MNLADQPVLSVLLNNMTHFVDIGAPEEAVMYYQTDGASHIRLPDGTVMHGSWKVNHRGYDVDWTNGPSGSWSFEYSPGRIVYVDKDGKAQGPITRIVPGDTAGLSDW
jgi:hypothetical protein